MGDDCVTACAQKPNRVPGLRRASLRRASAMRVHMVGRRVAHRRDHEQAGEERERGHREEGGGPAGDPEETCEGDGREQLARLPEGSDPLLQLWEPAR